MAVGCATDGDDASTGCARSTPAPDDGAPAPPVRDTEATSGETSTRAANRDTSRRVASGESRVAISDTEPISGETSKPAAPRDTSRRGASAESRVANPDTGVAGNPYDVPVDTPELRTSLTDAMRNAAKHYLNGYFSEHHLNHRGDNVFTIRLAGVELAPEHRDEISTRPVHVFRLPDKSEAPARVVQTYRRLLDEREDDDPGTVMLLIATGPRDKAEATLDHLYDTLHPFPARGQIRVMYTLAEGSGDTIRLSTWRP